MSSENQVAKVSRRTFLVSGLAAAGCVLTAPALAKRTMQVFSNDYVIGKTPVSLNIYEQGPGRQYVAPHNSETTCVEAALEVMNNRGGRLVQIITEGNMRNITFSHLGVRYVCDPNRIYTDRGIEASLRLLGGTYSKEAHEMVRTLAHTILMNLWHPDRSVFIALHNNTPTGRYSVRSYGAGEQYASEAREVHVNPEHSPKAFFFVTTAAWFSALAAKNENVVLQSAPPSDDGSLSVYCSQRSVRYVNVEAKIGDVAIQKRMIGLL